jgi:hypothetical protein
LRYLSGYVTRLRTKQLVVGIIFIGVGIWIARTGTPISPFLAFLACGLGGLGIAKGLGIISSGNEDETKNSN